jgi:spore maturation protein SpmB
MTTMMATALSTTVAIIVAKAMERLPRFAVESEGLVGIDTSEAERDIGELDTAGAEASIAAEAQIVTGWQQWAAWGLIGLVIASLGYALSVEASTVVDGAALGWLGAFQIAIKEWLLLLLLVGILLYGVLRGVKVYDAVVEGGKEGFQVALRIIPFLVAILVAVGMLRASGAIDLIVVGLEPITALVGMPAEALPMALLRTLSGSGAYGVSAEIMQTHGADSLIGQIVSTMQGSTETTFYVLALYFGVAQVRNGRHALPACLAADLAGALGAVWACRLILY